MVKLNFKNIPPIQGSQQPADNEKTSPVPPEKSEPHPENEFQEILTTEEDLTASLQAQLQEDTTIMAEVPAVVPESKTKKFKIGETREVSNLDAGFDSYGAGGSKKGWIIPVFIVLVLVATGFALYKFTDLFSSLPFIGEKRSPASVTEPAMPPAGETAAPSIPPLYLNNLGINRFLHSRFQQLMASSIPLGRFSLVIMMPGEINLQYLSESREKAAEFRGNLSKLFPDLSFRTVSSQTETVNNARLVFTNLTTRVNPELLKPSAASAAGAATSPIRDMQAETRGLAAKHKVTLAYLNAGKKIDSQSYFEHYFYTHVTGNKENLLSFLQEIASNPMIRLNKLSVIPVNTVTYSDKSLSARLNMSLIQLK